jgi:endoglucanase
MKKLSIKLILLLSVIFHFAAKAQTAKFISVRGKEIIGADNKPFLIRGTNLGNWLVPEGYLYNRSGHTFLKGQWHEFHPHTI